MCVYVYLFCASPCPVRRVGVGGLRLCWCYGLTLAWPVRQQQMSKLISRCLVLMPALHSRLPYSSLPSSCLPYTHACRTHACRTHACCTHVIMCHACCTHVIMCHACLRCEALREAAEVTVNLGEQQQICEALLRYWQQVGGCTTA